MKGNIYPKIVLLKTNNVSFPTRRDTWNYVKQTRRVVQRKANLVQEAESDEDEVFNAYHQRVIRGKIAPYVVKVEIEKLLL